MKVFPANEDARGPQDPILAMDLLEMVPDSLTDFLKMFRIGAIHQHFAGYVLLESHSIEAWTRICRISDRE